MSGASTIESRLAALEFKIAALETRLENATDSHGWLARVLGTFQDTPEFEEVLQRGRAYRSASTEESDRLTEDGA